MRRVFLSAAFALLATPIIACKPTLPFEGKWDCGVATFSFTATSFFNGTETLPIRSIDAQAKANILTFDDGYQIAVTRNDNGTLDWLSLASGDSFTCKAVN